MWKKGSTPMTRSGAGRERPWPANQASYIDTAAVRFAWLSTAPFGRPVVPPVYCRRAMLSASTLGQDTGGAAPLRKAENGITPARAGTGTVAVGEGPSASSSPTTMRSTSPESSSLSAFGSIAARFVVTRVRAPESPALCASTRSGSRSEMRDARARLRRAEESVGMVERVRQVERDRIAGAEAAPEEGGSGTIDRAAEFGKGEPALAELEGRPRPVRGDGLVEERAEGGGADRRVPPDARRIGALPRERTAETGPRPGAARGIRRCGHRRALLPRRSAGLFPAGPDVGKLTRRGTGCKRGSE